MAAPVAQHPLEQYEALEVIGNGSFGIIRKVRRRSDGAVLARKELNFERMTERDRKQIVAEVNILKDLCHENIVRYHDRYVDRDNGILYILMEYCGGGDLGTIIKNCTRANRPLPEDTIWNYFLQILLALQHCHFPFTDASSSSASAPRQQILHRDLKPENVFLDSNQVIKLGDFGLSKALGAASFANTYVGTPYYMSPELMQEKSYDMKSDIWSLGCLIYELCALKPPFHEAKTHNELSIFIRNGRIPPLPRGYSQALHQIIKSMLNINPAMRPSAQQLLQNERLELVSKVNETQKMLTLAKAHKQMIVNRERDVLLRERELQAQEASFQQRIASALARREAELEAAAVRRVQEREEELRLAVLRKEEEVRERMEKREAELLQAVMNREEELRGLWEKFETGLREQLREREEQVKNAEEQLKIEWERIQQILREKEEEESKAAHTEFRTSRNTHLPEGTPTRIPTHLRERSIHETPPTSKFVSPPVSAMRGVILTDTGEAIPTPHPVELARLVLDSPRVKLNFGGIFAGGRDYDEDSDCDESLATKSRERERRMRGGMQDKEKDSEQDKENVSVPVPPATRLRKPSIRSRPSLPNSIASCPAALNTTQIVQQISCAPTTTTEGSVSSGTQSLPALTAQSDPTPSIQSCPVQTTQSLPAPTYDLDDEENLPSPFLKRADLAKARRGSTVYDGHRGHDFRPKGGASNDLRAKAAANSARKGGRSSSGNMRPGTMVESGVKPFSDVSARENGGRTSLERAKLASEEAKKALFRS